LDKKASPSYLFGLTQEGLQALLASAPFSVPSFTARQIYEWLYQKKVWDPALWTNVSKELRAWIGAKGFVTSPLSPESSQLSKDGTQKYLFKLWDGGLIEAVIIPEDERVTLCLSSQVGCSHACFFCATARQGFKRNLTTYEILSQVASLQRDHAITNLVYMGMGEPFSNWDTVKETLGILQDERGFGFSSKKITVSTVGVFPALKDFVENTPCNLALSLHSPFADERKRLMPIETVYPVEEILAYLKGVTLSRPSYRFSIEYIVFKGLNHSPRHTAALVKLLHGLKVRVNLIPYHPIGNIPLESALMKDMVAFQEQLRDKGLITTIRRSRGMDIDAACGMLSTKKLAEEQNLNTLDY
jgi:23S rRNA (adenine2503-C2)-methyltransferase